MKRYNSYKDSGIVWIGEIPETWFVNLLKRGLSLLTDYEANGSFSSVKKNVNFPDKEEDEYAWYVRATDLEKQSYAERRNLRWVDEKTYQFLERTTLYGSELLVAKRGEIGKVYIMPNVETPSTLAPNLYLLRFNAKINSKFAYYYFQSGQGSEELKSKNRSTTIGAVYKDDLKEIKFIYPSLEEQIQIAHYLDHKTGIIDALIEKKELLIQKLQAQRQAIINEAVTKGLNPNAPMKDSGIEWLGEIPEHWEITSVKNILSIPITDGPHTTPELLEDGIPFISAESIKNGKIDFNKKRGYVSLEDYELFSKKYVPKKNDIYMVKSGATTGNIAKVETDDLFTIWSPLAVFRANDKKMNHDFLFYYLQSSVFKYQVELNWSYGTQQNIGMGVLSNLKISFPGIKEQIEIVSSIAEKFSQIEILLENIKLTIDQLKSYRQSIISEAVTGKIDVREWQPKHKTEA